MVWTAYAAGEGEVKARTDAKLAFCADRTAEHRDQLLAQIQAKPGTFVNAPGRPVHLPKRLKQVGQLLGSDANSRIDHFD